MTDHIWFVEGIHRTTGEMLRQIYYSKSLASSAFNSLGDDFRDKQFTTFVPIANVERADYHVDHS